MPFSIERHRQDRCLVLSLQGSFMGAGSAKKLRSAIRQVLAENQKLILVNVSGLRARAIRGCKRAIDDFGVESLLAGAFMTSYAGGALRIFGAAADVTAALERDGASHLFAHASDEEEAAEELFELVPNAQPFDILQFVREEERQNARASGVPEAQEGD